MKIYSRAGDDGTTGLLYGGRVAKASPAIVATGDIDEAQAALGVARAAARALDGPASPLDERLVLVERDLYVLMAEVTTAPANRRKLTPGTSAVTVAMVEALESAIDELTGEFPPLRDFAIPGHDPVTAALDLARTVVRRAERALQAALAAEAAEPFADAEPSAGADEASAGADEGEPVPASLAPAYLNRLSDLVWTMARWHEHGDTLKSRDVQPGGPL